MNRKWHELVPERETKKRLLVTLLVLVVALLAAGVATDGGDGTEPELLVTTDTPPTSPAPDGDATETPVEITEDTRTAWTAGVDGTPTRTTTPGSGLPDGPPTSTPQNGGPAGTDSGVGATGFGETGEGGPDGTSDDQTNDVELQIQDESVRIQVANVLPGDRGSESFVIENVGDGPGRLGASVVVGGSENSVLEPEQAAGDDGESGELSSALLVRVSVIDGSNKRTYLSGGQGGYVPLSSLDEGNFPSSRVVLDGGERATVEFEWKLPRSAGNEVQSDVAVFDATCRLRSTKTITFP